MANVLKAFNTKSPVMIKSENQSAGILDDYAIRKDIQTISATGNIFKATTISAANIVGTTISGATLVDTGIGNNQIIYSTNGTLSGSSTFVISGANVGIGTTSPSEQLEIYKSSAGDFDGASIFNPYWGVGAAGTLTFKHGDGTGDGVGNGAESRITSYLPGGAMSDLRFYTTNAGTLNTNPSMVIQGSGNVGIGTTGPSTKLHISGGALQISNTTAPATPAAAGALFISAGALFYIGSSGTQTQIAVA